MACVAFSWLIFRFVIGIGSFGIFPFIAAVGSMVFPIYNDFNKHRELQKVRSEAEDELSAETFKVLSDVTAPTTNSFGFIVMGEIAGIVLSGFVLFFIR